MYRISLTVSLCFILLNPFCQAQQISSVNLDEFKDCFFMKILWADTSGFCIAGDRKPPAEKFPHLISYFDTTGRIIYTTDKLKTTHSTSHSNCLVLGKTIFYLDDDVDNFGVH